MKAKRERVISVKGSGRRPVHAYLTREEFDKLSAKVAEAYESGSMLVHLEFLPHPSRKRSSNRIVIYIARASRKLSLELSEKA